jgi:photosystem II stability/assembly factor-like uncharacterized protein
MRMLGTVAEPTGVWIDITPSIPQPWSSDPDFYYGWNWIDGAKSGARGVLYTGADHGTTSPNGGLWKSTDYGRTWARTASQGPSNALVETGVQPIVVDPSDSNIVYAGSIKTGFGLFKSTDGGATFSTNIIPSGIEPDLYWLAMDPNDRLHLLISFHSAGQNWAVSGNAGLIESFDGGATWPNVIPAGGWTGAGQFVHFLGQNDAGVASGAYWIVATQGDGIWRTTNSGSSWTQVATWNMTHGMSQLYRAPNGSLYMGSIGVVYRSTNNGQTWSDTGAPSSGDGYSGIVGDGTNIWTMLVNTGLAAFGPYAWQRLPIADTTSAPGSSNWTSFGAATFRNGPARMLYDSDNEIMYASTWGGGIWKYIVP